MNLSPHCATCVHQSISFSGSACGYLACARSVDREPVDEDGYSASDHLDEHALDGICTAHEPLPHCSAPTFAEVNCGQEAYVP